MKVGLILSGCRCNDQFLDCASSAVEAKAQVELRFAEQKPHLQTVALLW